MNPVIADFELLCFGAVAAFMVGCCIGSFLNVCIWRMPRGESVIFAPSHCPRCGRDIPWYLNIPLLSWLVLRGKCISCRAPISFRYFGVELLTGIIYLWLFLEIMVMKKVFPPLCLIYSSGDYLLMDLQWLLLCAFAATLAITTFFIDLEHRIIPNKTTYPVMLFSVLVPVVSTLIKWSMHKPESFMDIAFAVLGPLIAFVICGGIMSGFALLGKWIFRVEAMGWGDVKYVTAIGMCLGIVPAFLILLFASIGGAGFGITRAVFNQGSLKSTIPFGPFLAVGTLFWVLGRGWILEWLNFLFRACPNLESLPLLRFL